MIFPVVIALLGVLRLDENFINVLGFLFHSMPINNLFGLIAFFNNLEI